jgi:hypothetical protein
MITLIIILFVVGIFFIAYRFSKSRAKLSSQNIYDSIVLRLRQNKEIYFNYDDVVVCNHYALIMDLSNVAFKPEKEWEQYFENIATKYNLSYSQPK